MIRLLSDHDVLQQAHLIWGVFSVDEWRYFGVDGFVSFIDVGLDSTASDRQIWMKCQSGNLLLLTANRNAEEADALTNVIAELNHVGCLPVLTIGRPQQIIEYSYREDCAYRIADIAVDLEQVRGSGRLFIP
jgi:hypothetical protein